MKFNEFQKAKLKLTLWYLLGIVLMLWIFNLVAIGALQSSFGQIESTLSDPIRRPFLTYALENSIINFEASFIQTLFIFNSVAYVLGAILSYVLADRTLNPIRKAYEINEVFYQDISHELKTPLSNIMLEIQAQLKTNKGLDEITINSLNLIYDQSKNMKILIENLLELSSLKNPFEKQNKNLKSADFENVLNKVLESFDAKLKNKKMLVQKNIVNSTIQISEKELEHIIGIVLDNAIKFSEENKEIIISSEKVKNILKIKIIDFGIGIDETNKNKIFERFYKNDKDSYGFGLGLSVAKKLITDNYGKITFYKNQPKGTVFEIELNTLNS